MRKKLWGTLLPPLGGRFFIYFLGKSQDCDVAAIAILTIFLLYMNISRIVFYHVFHFIDFSICIKSYTFFSSIYAYYGAQDHLICIICTLVYYCLNSLSYIPMLFILTVYLLQYALNNYNTLTHYNA